jgi:hypothetical protein
MSTAQFYDGLTDTYHTLYPNWLDETRAQADARRAALTELSLAAGLQDACWHEPRESGFFQPLMTAHPFSLGTVGPRKIARLSFPAPTSVGAWLLPFGKGTSASYSPVGWSTRSAMPSLRRRSPSRS